VAVCRAFLPPLRRNRLIRTVGKLPYAGKIQGQRRRTGASVQHELVGLQDDPGME
jgi:hypothetical protein